MEIWFRHFLNKFYSPLDWTSLYSSKVIRDTDPCTFRAWAWVLTEAWGCRTYVHSACQFGSPGPRVHWIVSTPTPHTHTHTHTKWNSLLLPPILEKPLSISYYPHNHNYAKTDPWIISNNTLNTSISKGNLKKLRSCFLCILLESFCWLPFLLCVQCELLWWSSCFVESKF